MAESCQSLRKLVFLYSCKFLDTLDWCKWTMTYQEIVHQYVNNAYIEKYGLCSCNALAHSIASVWYNIIWIIDHFRYISNLGCSHIQMTFLGRSRISMWSNLNVWILLRPSVHYLAIHVPWTVQCPSGHPPQCEPAEVRKEMRFFRPGVIIALFVRSHAYTRCREE